MIVVWRIMVIEGREVQEGLYVNVVYIYAATNLSFAFCLTLYTPFRDPRSFECSLALPGLARTNGLNGKFGHTNPPSLFRWHPSYQ
jgi:hypothetical protein